MSATSPKILKPYTISCFGVVLFVLWCNIKWLTLRYLVRAKQIWIITDKLSYLRWAQHGHRSGRVGRRGEWPRAAGGSVWCFYLVHSLRQANWESPLAVAEGILQTLHALLEEGACRKLKTIHIKGNEQVLLLKTACNKAVPRCQTHFLTSSIIKLGMPVYSAASRFIWVTINNKGHFHPFLLPKTNKTASKQYILGSPVAGIADISCFGSPWLWTCSVVLEWVVAFCGILRFLKLYFRMFKYVPTFRK